MFAFLANGFTKKERASSMSEFTLGQGLGHELEMAVERTGGVVADVQWLRTGGNFENVILLARGQAKLVRLAESKPPTIDPIVRIDRSVRPVYPDFLNQEYVNTPEFIALENLGPTEFDASKLRKWWHPQQKKKFVVGDVILAFLKGKEMIPRCLGYADLMGIQSKGIEFFRQHFNRQAVFGWRSVVPDRHGDLRVPYLILDGGRVVLHWFWLDSDFDAASPALRFARLALGNLDT